VFEGCSFLSEGSNFEVGSAIVDWILSTGGYNKSERLRVAVAFVEKDFISLDQDVTHLRFLNHMSSVDLHHLATSFITADESELVVTLEGRCLVTKLTDLDESSSGLGDS
jgi:hypothetical protein